MGIIKELWSTFYFMNMMFGGDFNYSFLDVLKSVLQGLNDHKYKITVAVKA